MEGLGSEIIGIDEVGRGCLAGPLLVAAARCRSKLPQGLNDSKKLTKVSRERLFIELVSTCDFGEGWVSVNEINQLGLAESMRLGVARALDGLNAATKDTIIIDGSINYCPQKYKNSKAIIKADGTVDIVSAASIYAKVTRDAYMGKVALDYPSYGFDRHVGYGTAQHLAAINQHGVIAAMHRLDFAPIKSILEANL